MYFSMAWREEPPRSFRAEMAALIISKYGGWSAALSCFVAALVVAGSGSDISKFLYNYEQIEH